MVSATVYAVTGLLAVFSGHMAFCSDNQFTGYDLISAGNNLALKIYDATSKKENVIMSPYSVTSALGLLYMMADGSTAQELTKILGITTSRYQNVAEAYRQAMQCLGKQDLHMANGIFMDWRIPMKESFKNFIRRQIDAQSENVDLSNRIEDTRRYINRWVDQNTQHMIPEFLDEDFSRSGPKLAVLCSAVHFKKDWARPFKKTTREKFFSEDGTSSTVDMMSCDDTRFGIASFREIGATALRIDYKRRTQSMIALLPEGKTTVEDLAKKLKRVNLMEDILKKIPVGTDLGQEIHVSMPKFNISSKFQLLDILTEMGFKAIGADFSKATDARRMELSKVYHEANIVVDEKGTEASGVTGADIVLLSFPPAVELNRPFLFFIIDWRCSAIISMGHFVKP